MISKINAATHINRNYYRNPISFKGYNTTSEDIDIYSKKINAPISSMSGDINIENSRVNGKVSNMSGDISIASSDITGNVDNLSGKIKIIENSKVKGNVSNADGTISLKKSSVSGNISSTDGNVLLRDSVVNGVITTKPENIKLEGKNKITELILTGLKKSTNIDINVETIKAELAKQNIFVGNIKCIVRTGDTVTNIFSDNTLKSSETVKSKKPLEFRLPKGNIIETIKFDADKKGILILEEGVEFLGKVVNGIIKRI